MKTDQPVTIYRKDYTPFAYLVDNIELTFQLNEECTLVRTVSSFRKNPLVTAENSPLKLFGQELELKSIALDGELLGKEKYDLSDKELVIAGVPNIFKLEIVTVIYPQRNTSLEGLYKSSGNFCTQCEAEGFRKITYFPDRPDVLSRYTTRIEAKKNRYPVLLSNGNLLKSGELEEGRHYVVWQDPFPKPSYLFALVAGDLVCIEDEFITASGRIVALKIYVEPRNSDKCEHAMRSLKKSMRWDEEVFGLEYDLDIYMIVAVDDFNMGAMENKGLNVFNSKYVLSTPESATDQDYLGIEGVIGHEYFHNWTGNRVTCRDWFQLSLKEGLTVFRDQQFSADMNSESVQRIDDVRVLKNFQFKEDSGPMAHPVRPDSFVEINNFYTVTVYNKGAEVIRMIHTLLGVENFRKGMDLYFERHDGQAVTCDDFVAAMADGSGVNLDQFKSWYSQSGTPLLNVEGQWDSSTKEYQLKVVQSCPETPGQKTKQPFHMPLKVGLVGAGGDELLEENTVVELTEKQQIFTFQNIEEEPVVSFCRDFSAPVKISNFQSRKELGHLAKFDTNLYNRWDSFARLSTDIILEIANQLAISQKAHVDELFLNVIAENLGREIEDPALLALALQLPSETTLAQEMDVVDPDNLHLARNLVKKVVAESNKDSLLRLYESFSGQKEYSISTEAMGERSLKNTCLSYLMALEPLPPEILRRCQNQFETSTNMTDTIGALSQLVQIDSDVTRKALEDFYKKWQKDPLVLDKWFQLQATSSLPGTLDKVKELLDNESFSMKNPNKVRALIGAFASGNHVRFHSADGAGYDFLGSRICELNEFNPQIAARLVSPLINWKRYDEKRQGLMKAELNKILQTQDLSQNVYEIVQKALQS